MSKLKTGGAMAWYRGKPLGDYTKEELIEIILEMGQMVEQERREHVRELEVLGRHQ